jgi:hypothetical protein
MPFTRSATADEILAKVALTQANIKSSSTITLSKWNGISRREPP